MSDYDTTEILSDQGAALTTPPAATVSPASSLSPASSGDGLPRPRIRWAGIVWGLVMAAAAGLVLNLALNVEARDAFDVWQRSLSSAGLVIAVVLVIGGVLLVSGIAGLLGRATRARSRSRR